MARKESIKTAILVVAVLFSCCAARNIPKEFGYYPDNDDLPESDYENQEPDRLSKECNLLNRRDYEKNGRVNDVLQEEYKLVSAPGRPMEQDEEQSYDIPQDSFFGIFKDIYHNLRAYEPFVLKKDTLKLPPESDFDRRVFKVHLDNGWISGLSKFSTADFASERLSSDSLELWLKWKVLYVKYTVTVDQLGKTDSSDIYADIPTLRMYVFKPYSKPARISMTPVDDVTVKVSRNNLPSEVVERTLSCAKNHIKGIVNNEISEILLESVEKALSGANDASTLEYE